MMAGMLAVAVVGASAAQVNATAPEHNTKATCTAAGYVWDAELRECADIPCWNSTFGGGEPGEIKFRNGKFYMCDGFSGGWVLYGRVQPTPLPPNLDPVKTKPTPAGPVAPLPTSGLLAR